MNDLNPENNISSTVTMDDDVILGRNVRIHGNGVIKKGVKIGNGVIIEGNFFIDTNTIIDDYCILRGDFSIGSNNWIYPFCTIGTGPQHSSYLEKSEDKLEKNGKKIIIGSNNIIREYTTIHLPALSTKTEIGSDCFIMAYCHIAHDCIVHDHIIMANQTTLGGHVEVDDYANIGLNVAIHQFCKIGSYSMIGMGNIIVKDILPFSLIIDQKFLRINKIGLKRNGINNSDIDLIHNFYCNFTQNTNKKSTWFEKSIHSFIEKSKRSYYLPYEHNFI